jgi:hypothetical protein
MGRSVGLVCRGPCLRFESGEWAVVKLKDLDIIFKMTITHISVKVLTVKTLMEEARWIRRVIKFS